MAEKSLRGLHLSALARGRIFFPSPQHWEDEIIYFLLVDRFSDGREDRFRGNDGNVVTTGSTPLFTPADNGNAVTSDADALK